MQKVWIVLGLVTVVAACRSPSGQPLSNCLPDLTGTPSERETQQALQIARPYIYSVLSDDRVRAKGIKIAPMFKDGAQTLGLLPVAPPDTVPSDFTIQDRPFSRYKMTFEKGPDVRRTEIHISCFDPVAHPDWQTIGGMDGGFPGYFTVTVDLARKEVVQHYASPM